MNGSITWGEKLLLQNNVWSMTQPDLSKEWSDDTAAFLFSKMMSTDSVDIESAIWIVKQLLELPNSPCVKCLTQANILDAIKSGLRYDNDETRHWCFKIIKIVIIQVPNMAYDLLRTDCVTDMINYADTFVTNQLWDELITALQVFKMINTDPCVHRGKEQMKRDMIQLCGDALDQLISIMSYWPQTDVAKCIMTIADVLQNIAFLEESFDAAGILVIQKSILQTVRLCDVWDADLWSIIKTTLDRRLSTLPQTDVRDVMISILFSYKISNNYQLKNEVLNILINFCKSLPFNRDINDYIPKVAVKWLCKDPSQIWAEIYNSQSRNTESQRMKCLIKSCQSLCQLIEHGMGVYGDVIGFALKCIQRRADMPLVEAAVSVIKAQWIKMTSFQQHKCLKSGIFAAVANLCDSTNAQIIDDLLYTFVFGN